jgi:TrmH family RNA methyltransferase
MPLADPITSRENPLFQALRALAERPRERRESGKTLLDGEHLLQEALASGLCPERLIFQEGYAQAVDWQARLPDVPVSVMSHGLFKALSPVATPVGLLAILPIPTPTEAVGSDAILLEDIQDPGNLGALLRTAAAANVGQVYLSTGCAEAWSPKALRGGQGAQFRLQIHEQADLAKVADHYQGQVLAAALRAPATLYGMDLSSPTAFLFGNEGAGLSAALLEKARPFSIPMPGGVESLNVAAAAAICLFEQVRQRAAVMD